MEPTPVSSPTPSKRPPPNAKGKTTNVASPLASSSSLPGPRPASPPGTPQRQHSPPRQYSPTSSPTPDHRMHPHNTHNTHNTHNMHNMHNTTHVTDSHVNSDGHNGGIAGHFTHSINFGRQAPEQRGRGELPGREFGRSGNGQRSRSRTPPRGPSDHMQLDYDHPHAHTDDLVNRPLYLPEYDDDIEEQQYNRAHFLSLFGGMQSMEEYREWLNKLEEGQPDQTLCSWD